MTQNGKTPSRGALLADRVKDRQRMAEAQASAASASPTESVLAGRAKSAAFLSNKLDVVALHNLDRALSVPSPENARAYSDLTYDNCKDLIDSILAEGAQRIPAIVRNTGKAEHPYEIVAGSRRHFAISWLRANNYPEFTYLAQVQELEDEQAFRLSDLENRARSDISAKERGDSYKRALDLFYNGDVRQMSDRLRIARGHLYKYLAIASIDSEIVAAFANPTDLTTKNADELVAKIKSDPSARAMMVREAGVLEKEQKSLRESGAPTIKAEAVIRRLLDASSNKAPKASSPSHVEHASSGAVLFTWTPARGRGGVSIKIPNDKTMSRQELKNALSKLVDQQFDKLRD